MEHPTVDRKIAFLRKFSRALWLSAFGISICVWKKDSPSVSATTPLLVVFMWITIGCLKSRGTNCLYVSRTSSISSLFLKWKMEDRETFSATFSEVICERVAFFSKRVNTASRNLLGNLTSERTSLISWRLFTTLGGGFSLPDIACCSADMFLCCVDFVSVGTRVLSEFWSVWQFKKLPTSHAN